MLNDLNNTPQIGLPNRSSRRGSIYVHTDKPTEADRRWYGKAPRVASEKDKNWRPKDWRL